MSWCTVRGWRWERQDVMVYCERLEMGKAGCHGVLPEAGGSYVGRAGGKGRSHTSKRTSRQLYMFHCCTLVCIT